MRNMLLKRNFCPSKMSVSQKTKKNQGVVPDYRRLKRQDN